ncbi:MAG TPA: hypothetical protein VMS21_04055, partial [Methylomirabilota bacterium]|nr:hypothetical protein [Methylomirabilota bacterium]
MNTQDSSRSHPSIRHTLFSLLLAAFCAVTPHAGAATVDVKDLAINGGIEDGKARLVIEAMLAGQTGDRDKLIHSTTLHHHVRATRDRLTHHIAATFDILQGNPRELTLRLQGEGHIREVTGESLESWSIRTGPDGDRNLVIHPRRTDPPLIRLTVTIRADQDIAIDDTARPLFTLAPTQPALLNGYLRLESAPDLELKPENPSGLIPIETRLLPDNLLIDPPAGTAEPLAFQFHGAPYSLPLRIAVADPEARRVVLRNFKLEGELTNDHAAFTLTATAHLKNPDGGELVLLTGNAALTDVQPGPGQKVRFENGRFILSFEEPGEHPIRVHFHAAVHSSDGWNSLDFGVAASVLQPLILNGLPEETQFRFPGAARPERIGDDFVSYLPADGTVRLSWKAARPELEGRLFYAASMLSQIIVSPGLMRQTALLDFKVMQGELNRVELILRGNGEVTRVQGGSLLSWNLLPIPDSEDRRLVVELNQAQRDQFSILVQMQTPIGAFPQTVDALELRPEGATRFAGHFRIVNEGAVRLEVAESSGLSQISPEQFPESDATRALLSATGSQRFAYRFSSPDFALRIQADQILPEISVSQVLAYHLGETELAIDAEFELDIREAPLRELLIRVPRGYPIARLVAPGLSDYFLVEPESETDAELRLVYGEPVSGRQIIQLRLERNASLGETNWPLPRVEVLNPRSTRGQVAASADPGFRLTPERIVNLTELATAFFPKQLPGIQAAFRLSEPNWELTLRVERLPQSVQADAFHLFSIGEGIAYGSSVINYVVSGAPISSFRIALSGEYFNVEFTGQDVRNWQATDGGYLVHLHTPVAGAYTLLATYERPFRSQGETLAFTGTRPLDAQSEQGHTLVTSAYQFDVTAVDVSSGLLPLEPGEVPPQYRLFFDAPILAAYRYTSRPFNLSLALSPLAQGDSLSLVVDRASLVTRISKEGQVITDARYFVKNRGNTHFRIVLPEGTELWSATVNGAPVVPVTDARANLIPLPQQADPDTVLQLDLKLAERSERPERVQVAAPIVSAPVMLAQWTVEPDAGRRLLYRDGSLTPASGLADASGFAQLARVFKGSQGAVAAVSLVSALALMAIAAWVWRWTAQNGVHRFSARHLLGTLLGAIAFAVALGAVMNLAGMAGHEQSRAPGSLTFLAPVQQAGSALHVQVANIEADAAMGSFLTGAWPALLAIAIWLYTLITDKSWFKPLGRALGWTLLAWAALRIPNGAPAFFSVGVLFLLLHVLIPAGRRLWQLPPKPAPEEPPSSTGSTAPIATSLLIGGLLWLATTPIQAQAQPSQSPSARGLQAASSSNPHNSPLAQSVTQQLRIDEDFAGGSATIQWTARKGELLPLLFEPAVLTGITYPSNSLKLVQVPIDGRHARQLLALESGGFTVELQYQIHVRTRDGETGIALPTHHGLVNRLELTLPGLDMDVLSQQAVSVQRRLVDNDTIASLILAPVNDAWITWKPRSRDVKSERPVFYAELFQLHVPAGGAIEGIHRVAIRPAQGELEHLTFIVPDGMTIIDVFDRDPTATTIDPASGRTVSPLPSNVSLWRFDPDARRLRVNLATPQSRPFTLHIRSQVATGPLPFEQSLGLIAVEDSAGQIGLFGLATGNEVQIDSVNLQGFSPINLEDFPEAVLHPLYNLFPGLSVRRAWRYADPGDTATVAASAVEPDVRVESQSTLSLGEDRIVLAADAAVEITRAGIFRLSFLMPDGLDVESITSPALS